MSDGKTAKECLIKKIYEITAGSTPRDYRKHKIIMLEGILNRLDQLAIECRECNIFFNSFETDIIDKLKAFDNVNQRAYHLNLKKVLGHLRSKHKLTVVGYYTETYMSLGTIIGFLLGLVMGNFGMGIAIGIFFGLVVGVVLDLNAKKKGKVIFTPPRQP